MSLLELRGVSVQYGRAGRRLTAVDRVDLSIGQGETVGLVGESGSGKSTLAKAIVGLLPVSSGLVLLDGADAARMPRRARRDLHRRVQLVFQDPYSSLNPRMTIGDSISEAIAQHRSMSRERRLREVQSLLEQVGLAASDSELYPFQFSGGQRQRVAIARALAVQPDLIIADEITSSLDVSIQAAILNLIREIKRTRNVALLLISHNLGVIRYASERVAVMHLGQVVEARETEELFAAPRHPYTRALIDSVPRLGGRRDARIRIQGEVPDPHDPPSGCRFHTRCPFGPLGHPERTICTTTEPSLDPLGSAVACHFPLSARAEPPVESDVSR